MSSAVKTVFGGSDDSAQKSQEAANARSAQYTKEQAKQARRDALSLFPAAEKNILAGGQAALDLLGGLVPQQIDAMRAGSSAARDAILGTGRGDVNFTPDYSILQQILPGLRNPDDRFGSAANIEGSPVQKGIEQDQVPDFLRGMKTNEELLMAASRGDIPGLESQDQNWYGNLLNDMRMKGDGNLALDTYLTTPQEVIDRHVGLEGELNPANEQRLKRLLDRIINPNVGEGASSASRFLGGGL